MTDKATLIALAERVEKAEAGTREVRNLSWALLILAAVHAFYVLGEHKPEHYVAGAIFLSASVIVRTINAASLRAIAENI